MVTDEDLKAMATQVANMFLTDHRNGHTPNAVLAVYHEGEGLFRLKKLEQLIEDSVGVHWANDAGKRRRVWMGMRLSVEELKPDAVVIGTGANLTSQTLPDGERSTVSAIVATAQSAERACVWSKSEDGEASVFFCDEAEFQGTAKMYGAPLLEAEAAFLNKCREKLQAQTAGASEQSTSDPEEKKN